MRNLIWIVLAVVILGGVYLLFSGKTPGEAVSEAADAITPTATESSD
ncbi:MAG: hypothetical protein AAF943_11605 [Pseudomonadota bacterium]